MLTVELKSIEVCTLPVHPSQKRTTLLAIETSDCDGHKINKTIIYAGSNCYKCLDFNSQAYLLKHITSSGGNGAGLLSVSNPSSLSVCLK